MDKTAEWTNIQQTGEVRPKKGRHYRGWMFRWLYRQVYSQKVEWKEEEWYEKGQQLKQLPSEMCKAKSIQEFREEFPTDGLNASPLD